MSQRDLFNYQNEITMQKEYIFKNQISIIEELVLFFKNKEFSDADCKIYTNALINNFVISFLREMKSDQKKARKRKGQHEKRD